MNLLRRLTSRDVPLAGEAARFGVDEWAEQFTYAANNYLVTGVGGHGNTEAVTASFVGHTLGGLQSNGPVFAAMLARLMLFSEARFAFQRLRNGRPGDLFATPALRILEEPWPGGTTGDLLTRMIMHVDLGGNSFVYARSSTRLQCLRPDWTQIVMTGDPQVDADVEVFGYIYRPGGIGEPVLLAEDRVTQWAPIPDPLAAFRGMSWLDPIRRDVQADRLATKHKGAFFENGATLQTVISLDKAVTPKQFEDFSRKFAAKHQGAENAYRNLVVGGGASVQVIGADMKQLDFSVTQGAGETRIASASGIHPVILGMSEGLSGSSLNQGNFNAARRLTADKTMRPLWRSACDALAKLVRVPSDARLWYDPAGVAFLREDRKDLAEIQTQEAQTIRALVDGGWDPESVKAAVAAQDWALLKHSGLTSVQLQPPGATPDLGGK